MGNLFKNCFGHEVKIQLVRETAPVKEYQITKPYDVYVLVKEELETLDREVFLVITLNTKNKVLGLNVVSMGSINASYVHPREVFKSAILMNASCVILAHNHPSGDTTPSKDDRAITEKLFDAGKVLGIEIVDHIIVGNNFFSFMENGLLKGRQKGD
jgi:DNA repair protein RadC